MAFNLVRAGNQGVFKDVSLRYDGLSRSVLTIGLGLVLYAGWDGIPIIPCVQTSKAFTISPIRGHALKARILHGVLDTAILWNKKGSSSVGVNPPHVYS